MLAASAFTVIQMKDVIQTLHLSTGADQGAGLSPSSSPSSVPYTSTSPPATVDGGTAAQLLATEAASTAVSRNGRDRDSSWLELEACREHIRQACPRPASECRYAHPGPGIYVKDGRVTCCYDYLKDRCYRERCRYFHPPRHIKDRLVNAGRQFGAMMSNIHIIPGGVPSSPFHGLNSGPTSNSFSHLNPVTMPLIGPVIYSPDGRVMSAAPPGFIPGAPFGPGNERIDICPYFARGKCQNHMCPMLHPEPHVRLNLDSTVTICRDFIRGGCLREKCRYYHPPGNILSQLDSGALPALLQQGIMVASPVMPVYSPLMYPGAVTSFSSPAGAGMALYPSIPAVPLPVVLTPSPPPPVRVMQHFNNPPISKITSVMQGAPFPTTGTTLAIPAVPLPVVLTPSPPPPVRVMQHFNNPPISKITSVMQGAPFPTTGTTLGSPPRSIIIAPPPPPQN